MRINGLRPSKPRPTKGTIVRAGPEEIGAVQVFAKMLVEDYGYPKTHVRTRPQWRVRARPSDTKKEYPVDIAVFTGPKHADETLTIVVECKKPNRRDGRKQLEDYLRFSIAQVGVWFNGQEKLFLKKTESKGRVLFEEIPNIPKHGERLEDIGLYRRQDLRPAHNLKSVFRTIRNYLAANAVGITRDEVFAQQIINLIFCKIYDERFTKPADKVRFRAGIDEKPADIKERVLKLFAQVKKQYNDVIEATDEILLDEATLTYVVGELQLFCLVETQRDAIADAFETFIGPSLKGGQGQFFTPRNVVKLLVQMAAPTPDDKIIDPACGSGGFLVDALREVWKRLDERGRALGWPETEIQSEQQKIAIKNLRGLDKDSFLAKVAKAYMAIIGDGRGGVFCENSLDLPKRWKAMTREHIALGSFDVVLTNPPFGKKLKIDDTSILSNYSLGHRWASDKDAGTYDKTDEVHGAQAPQILFFERCLDLLNDGGRIAMIAPESMFCNPSHRYIVRYIESVARIRAVVSLPEELFQPYTHAKACGVLIEKIPTDPTKGHDIFMAVAKWCGHDSRGLPIDRDDIPRIFEKFTRYNEKGKIPYDHWGFVINRKRIVDNIYLPKYYNPEIPQKLRALSGTHDLLTFGDLVNEGALTVTTGHEVGKLAYGSGPNPFIRTSDIANWEIKLDPKHGLSDDLYDALKTRQDVQENDILMVRDGTYLVGTCAIVSRADTRIVFQSHIYKIRSNDPDRIHPFLLLALLSSPIVREQIFAKRFTQDIIDTLGSRIRELVLPVPKDGKARKQIVDQVAKALELKSKARDLTRAAMLGVAPTSDGEDPEFMMLLK